MKCHKCKKEMKAARGEISYPVAGMTFRLQNVPGYRCPICKDEEFGIPAIKSLNVVLARFFIQIPKLSGNQFKFLRKLIGLTQEELALNLGGLNAGTISHWETDSKREPDPSAALILKKMADEHITKEFEEFQKFQKDFTEAQADDQRVDDFFKSTSMTDFVKRLSEQNLKAKTSKVPKLRYNDSSHSFVIVA